MQTAVSKPNGCSDKPLSMLSRLSRKSWQIAVLGPLAFLISACGPEPEKPAETVPPNPLMFEIANADGEIEGWMLGTIHALPPDTQWRTPAIEVAIKEADLLVVEVANLTDRKEIAQTLTKLSQSDDLPELWQRVGRDHRQALDEVLDRSPFSMDDFDQTETWAAALMLAQVGAEGDPAFGVDKIVIADFDGREVIELEGARKQLGIFDNLPTDDQRDLLEGVLIEAQTANGQRGKLRNAWLQGDAKLLDQATRTGIMADRELREALLIRRNADWDKRLAKALAQPEKPLIAVGAAHLVGSDSLPALLEMRGYSVERIGT